MALEAISTSPALEDFTLLSEHQVQTPHSFFGGKPVLHLHSSGASVRISRDDLNSQSALLALLDGNVPSQDEVLIEQIDMWVTSR